MTVKHDGACHTTIPSYYHEVMALPHGCFFLPKCDSFLLLNASYHPRNRSFLLSRSDGFATIWLIAVTMQLLDAAILCLKSKHACLKLFKIDNLWESLKTPNHKLQIANKFQFTLLDRNQLTRIYR